MVKEDLPKAFYLFCLFFIYFLRTVLKLEKRQIRGEKRIFPPEPLASKLLHYALFP